MKIMELIDKAISAREAAYCPYSGFAVGACLVTKNGTFITGCNIENTSYSPTVCAERVAFFKAVSSGEREFQAIAIVGGMVAEALTFCSPCGVCRQVMSEFCESDFQIILAKSREDYTVYTLNDLLPLAFHKD
jgi:cytidine deaminase, homotetrameric